MTQPRGRGPGHLGAAWRVGREYLLAACLVLLPLVPFLGKAFHIDDVYYIEVAHNILASPGDPFAGAVALEDIDHRVFAEGRRAPETFAAMSHPPLVPYVIAFGAWLSGGWAETSLHGLFLCFALIGTLATLDLAKRFTSHPLTATLCVTWSPPFLLGAQSLMTDVPALALSLLALAVLVRGLDNDRPGIVLAAGVPMGLALVTRYSAAAGLVVLLAYGWSRGRLRRACLAAVPAAAIFALWCAQNLIVHGTLHLIASTSHYGRFYQGHSLDWSGVIKKSLDDLAGLGGIGLGVSLVLLAAGRWRRWATVAFGAMAATGVFVLRPPGIERLETYSFVEIAMVAWFAGCGLLLLAVALQRPRYEATTGQDWWFLAAWLAWSAATTVAVLPFGAVRYLLPVLPPLVFLLVRAAEAGAVGRGPHAWSARLGLPLSSLLLLSLAISIADTELAEAYKSLAQRVRSTYPASRLWYVGEWGFRHYMEASGASYLRSQDTSPMPGDIIIRPQVAGMHEIAPQVRERSAVSVWRIKSRWPVRVMSFEAKAGYYSHHWGFLPFALSTAPLDRVEVLDVGPRTSSGADVRSALTDKAARRTAGPP